MCDVQAARLEDRPVVGVGLGLDGQLVDMADQAVTSADDTIFAIGHDLAGDAFGSATASDTTGPSRTDSKSQPCAAHIARTWLSHVGSLAGGPAVKQSMLRYTNRDGPVHKTAWCVPG